MGNDNIFCTLVCFQLALRKCPVFNSVCSYFCALIFTYLCNVTRVSILSGTKVRELP